MTNARRINLLTILLFTTLVLSACNIPGVRRVRGSATIWVNNNLKASLKSSGDVRYRGDPTVDATTDSSGDVIHISD